MHAEHYDNVDNDVYMYVQARRCTGYTHTILASTAITTSCFLIPSSRLWLRLIHFARIILCLVGGVPSFALRMVCAAACIYYILKLMLYARSGLHVIARPIAGLIVVMVGIIE